MYFALHRAPGKLDRLKWLQIESVSRFVAETVSIISISRLSLLLRQSGPPGNSTPKKRPPGTPTGTRFPSLKKCPVPPPGRDMSQLAGTQVLSFLFALKQNLTFLARGEDTLPGEGTLYFRLCGTPGKLAGKKGLPEPLRGTFFALQNGTPGGAWFQGAQFPGSELCTFVCAALS